MGGLARIPDKIDGEFTRSWVTAERVYQSEAVGSFDKKHLLHVHETVKEAEKAFAECGKEYQWGILLS